MTPPPSRDELPIRWLHALIIGTLGLGSAACAERSIDIDLGDAGDEIGDGTVGTDGGSEGVDDGSLPPDTPIEPFVCPDADFTVEGTLLGDGTCAECDDACWAEVRAIGMGSPWYCDASSCSCDYYEICTPTYPDESGRCLHGFQIELWCGEGRPLLAAGELRLAPSRPRADWLTRVPKLAVPARAREAVRAGWLELAAMEHASVAAFARFTIQLLGLGAPAELIEAAQRAGQDELRHARQCYAIASQLCEGSGAGAVGPDRLELAGLDLDADPAQVALESILEGCIGETIAAAKMRLLADRAADPELAAVLRAIADDEAAHAALAWRALRWMLEVHGAAIEAAVRSTFAEALAGVSPVPRTAPEGGALLAYGVLDGATSDWMTAKVLAEVVAPAAVGLVCGRPARAA